MQMDSAVNASRNPRAAAAQPAPIGADEAVTASPTPGFEPVFIVGDETGAEHDLSRAETLLGWRPEAHRLLGE